MSIHTHVELHVFVSSTTKQVTGNSPGTERYRVTRKKRAFFAWLRHLFIWVFPDRTQRHGRVPETPRSGRSGYTRWKAIVVWTRWKGSEALVMAVAGLPYSPESCHYT